jgi:hypothetical protein
VRGSVSDDNRQTISSCTRKAVTTTYLCVSDQLIDFIIIRIRIEPKGNSIYGLRCLVMQMEGTTLIAAHSVQHMSISDQVRYVVLCEMSI